MTDAAITSKPISAPLDPLADLARQITTCISEIDTAARTSVVTLSSWARY
jgi:hypothetical protein